MGTPKAAVLLIILRVERLLDASYRGSTVAEGFAETQTVNARIIRDLDDWEPLTTKVVIATWAAPGSAIPHSIPRDVLQVLDEKRLVAIVSA